MALPGDMPVPPAPRIADVVFAAARRAPPAAVAPRPAARRSGPAHEAPARAFQVPPEMPAVVPDVFAPEPEDADECIGCVFDPMATDGSAGPGSPDGVLGGAGPGSSSAPVAVPIRVGGHIQPPRRIRHVDPLYPELARRAGVAGVVVLECVIDREGAVRRVRVVSGHPLLDTAAVAAVREWSYRPTLLNGMPIEIVMTVTVRFATR
jgi:protein TonB